MNTPAAASARPSVLVTGAGNGLGRAIAAAATEAGWSVGVLDRDGDAARHTAEQLGRHAVALPADVADEAQLEDALDRFASHTGSLAPTGCVCNAGIVRFGPLLELPLADFSDVLAVNLTGAFVSARAVAARMVRSGTGGSIVAVTSMNGVAAGPNAGAYGASKAGLARLVEQMALEWGAHGIRVNAVAPGLIDAGMSAPIYDDERIRARRSAAVPLGRLGTPEDVSAAVLFLLSDASGYVSGTELLVDGAVTRSVIATLPRPASVDSVGERDARP